MNRYRSFKCYVNLDHTEPKLRALIKEFPFGKISESIALLEPLPERPGPADGVTPRENKER